MVIAYKQQKTYLDKLNKETVSGSIAQGINFV